MRVIRDVISVVIAVLFLQFGMAKTYGKYLLNYRDGSRNVGIDLCNSAAKNIFPHACQIAQDCGDDLLWLNNQVIAGQVLK